MPLLGSGRGQSQTLPSRRPRSEPREPSVPPRVDVTPPARLPMPLISCESRTNRESSSDVVLLVAPVVRSDSNPVRFRVPSAESTCVTVVPIVLPRTVVSWARVGVVRLGTNPRRSLSVPDRVLRVPDTCVSASVTNTEVPLMEVPRTLGSWPASVLRLPLILDKLLEASPSAEVRNVLASLSDSVAVCGSVPERVMRLLLTAPTLVVTSSSTLLRIAPAWLAELAVTPVKELVSPVKLLFTMLRLPAMFFSTALSSEVVLMVVPLVRLLRLVARDVVLLATLVSSVLRAEVVPLKVVLVRLGAAALTALSVLVTDWRLLAMSRIELLRVLAAWLEAGSAKPGSRSAMPLSWPIAVFT